MLLSTFNDRLAFVYLLLLGLGSLVAYGKLIIYKISAGAVAANDDDDDVDVDD